MIDYKKKVVDAIIDRRATIAIVGMGYVGLPLVLRYVEQGFNVIGFDVDEAKTEALTRGESYIKHIDGTRIKEACRSGKFSATVDFSRIPEADSILICVPTPLTRHREPDLTYVVNTIESMVPYLRVGQLLSLESTTYPGTTDELIRPKLEACGFAIGKDFFLVYSPEREDPGNPTYSVSTIPKVVGGDTPGCVEVGRALYGAIIERVVVVSSTRAAEMTKLLENIYRAVNIGLVNELKVVADKMGFDIWEVIDAAATKPFGYTPFYPGPGLGGHCIPIDPFYLTWKAREYGLNTRFIELAGEVNTAIPDWVVAKITEALNLRHKSVNGANVLILGLAYKKNVDDMRESPAIKLMQLLQTKGALLTYSDPYIPRFPTTRNYSFDLASVELTEDRLRGSDCVVLVTDHSDFDYKYIVDHAQLIVDTRGVYRNNEPNVVTA